MGRQKLSESTIKIRLKQHKALELRLAGWTLEEIKDEVHYASRGSTYTAIESALKRECPQESVEKLRAVMSARFIRLLKAVWPLAKGNPAKDIPPDLQALDRAVKLLERLCRLHGLDKPIEIKSDMTITTEDPLEKLTIEELGNLADLFAKYTAKDIDFLAQAGAAQDPGGDGEAPPDYRH